MIFFSRGTRIELLFFLGDFFFSGDSDRMTFFLGGLGSNENKISDRMNFFSRIE